VGCATEDRSSTGVTVVLFDRLSPTVVDVRGPASATYDTHSLGLDATYGRRDALFLSGGSVYGLDAARGVRTSLLRRGRGEGAFAGSMPVPRIAGAALYDLPAVPGPLPDYLPLGFEAAEQAGAAPVPCGPFGAGRGARIGKYAGRGGSIPGGQSSSAVRIDRTHWVGVLVVFNSVGAIRDPRSGRWIEGARDRAGRLVPPDPSAWPSGPAGTTLAILATNLPLERPTLLRLAGHVHDGIARVVHPAHTATEGDSVFAASTAAPDAPRPVEERPGALADRLGRHAELLVEEAALRLFSGRPGTALPAR